MTYSQEIIDDIAGKTARGIYSSLFFEDGTHASADTQRIRNLIMYISSLCREMNSACGTRARKKLETLCDVLRQRGITCVESDHDYTAAVIGECRISIAYHRGIEIALDGRNSGHIREFMHCTASENDIADFMECIAAIDAKSRLLMEERYLNAGRDRMISEVEYPLVEKEVADFLVPRGINYILENIQGENTLGVQIVHEIWIRKAVSSEDLEQDLRIIPYLIKRPDCVKRDGRGFRIYHNWNWAKKRK